MAPTQAAQTIIFSRPGDYSVKLSAWIFLSENKQSFRAWKTQHFVFPGLKVALCSELQSQNLFPGCLGLWSQIKGLFYWNFMDDSWHWPFFSLDHEGEERVLLLFSLLLLYSRDILILKVNYTIQVYKVNLDLKNPLADLLWLIYHWTSANFSSSNSQLTKY